LLITDFTSLGLFYPLLEKPIIYYNNKNVKFYKESLGLELMKYSYCIENLNHLSKDITKAFNTFDVDKMKELKNKIFSNVENSLFFYKKEIYNTLNLPMN